MTKWLSLGLLMVAALGACGDPTVTMVTVQLSTESGSGETGIASLLDKGNGTTELDIQTMGGSDPGPQQADLRMGVCGGDGAIVTALSSVVNNYSSSTLHYMLPSLTDGMHYIDVHRSTDASVIQACGDIL